VSEKQPRAQDATAGAGARSAFALVFAAASSVCFAFARSLIGYEWVLYLLGVATAISAIALQVSKVVLDFRRDVEAANFRVLLRDALLPVTGLVAEMQVDATSQVRREQIKTVATAAVGGICALITPHAKRVRANVFWFAPAPVDDEPDLVWLAHAGRGERPDKFERGTDRGDGVIKFLQGLKPAFYPDLRKIKPDTFVGNMDNYTTFIAVPIWASGNVYGMVTVDAPKARSLVREDLYVVEMFADVVSIAFERGMNVSEPAVDVSEPTVQVSASEDTLQP
jgi:hypothetical protein